MGRDHIPGHDHIVLRFLILRQFHQHRADSVLDLLPGSAADTDAVLLGQVVDDVGRDLVPGHVNTGRLNDTTEGDDGDLRRPAAYVNHHAALRHHHVQADPHRRGHRLIDHKHIVGAGVGG